MLTSEGSVEDAIAFGLASDKTLRYRVEKNDITQEPAADYRDGQIILQIPKVSIEHWASTDEVAIEATQLFAHDAKLRILVEKDFACLKPRVGEDDLDAFAHPQQYEKC